MPKRSSRKDWGSTSLPRLTGGGHVDWLDAELLAALEGRAVIEQVASDLCSMFDPRPNAEIDWGRYPPW